ncbi:DNA helicase HerA-like ATPase [Okibacterium sp. HSC-33S16]|uniref:helicase HerA-like domain-containing protein n=1 Tax=Okibacterium sp. HSC-33S16 TaxID=2910965 RepID=UPI00209D5587|nr:helicase HerA-like domain-containing protein [Okibacterium sp. HSC-33S16]MCP2032039.1 DNA helicase HerA-like ATPase [Okibacterium sp. HSC-33S16]
MSDDATTPTDPLAAARAEAEALATAASEAQAAAAAALQRLEDAAAAARANAEAQAADALAHAHADGDAADTDARSAAAAATAAKNDETNAASEAARTASVNAQAAANATTVAAHDAAEKSAAAATDAATRSAVAATASVPDLSDPPSVPVPVPDAPATTPAAGPLDDGEMDRIRAGYAFEGAALQMGALVNGDPVPDVQVRIPLAMMNRHGLVAGATGTGKTRTLQVLAEQLSAHGVSVFAADIKGDLSGMAVPGEGNDKLLSRTAGIGQDWAPASFPLEYFSLGGVGRGVPIRATIAGFGPILLSKVLGLNDTQESSLGLVFHYAESAGLPLLDLTDLRAVLTFLASDEGKGELKELGGLSGATVGVILRELITFADQGADVFFGEPEIDTAEFLRTTADGRGIISLLEVPGVQDRPALYSTFLMWLLADLFNDLPEVGDLDQPKLVFFFDEAHLLFRDASKDFLAQITQTVRLIRSKGVGIFFVTQTPKDVPADVLGQLGSRVQHQLRAFTPDDAKALRATVSTYPTSAYDLAEVLTGLGTGEAVVTVMNERGAPSPVAWTRLRAPQGLMSPRPDADLAAAVHASALLVKYGTAIDRESAREILSAKLEAANQAAAAEEDAVQRAKAEAEYAKQKAAIDKAQAAAQKKADAEYERLLRRTQGTARRRTTRSEKTVLEQVLTSRATKTILTGVVEGIFGTRRRR